MHTPQHTPGPWHIGSAFDLSGTKLAVWPEPSEALNPICAIAAQDELLPTDWNNARLISAAPDLLALLQEIIANYQADRETSERYAQSLDEEYEYEYPEWYSRACAAVQKATTLTDQPAA